MNNTWKIVLWILALILSVACSILIFRMAENKINATVVSIGMFVVIYCIVYGFIWLADELEDWWLLIFNPKKLNEKLNKNKKREL